MRTLVLGAGLSGTAAARLAGRLGHEVRGFDEDSAAAEAARDSGLSFRSGSWDRAFTDDVDLVVTSPGIPEHHQMIRDVLDSGRVLWSELEFASRQVTAPLVAVTGTNGKTSTVAAAVAMLEASGAKACAAGNIGTALSDVAQEAWDVIVVEASSFQLRFIDGFHPAAAAVLNVTPDHLDWHGTFERYLYAKRRITENLGPADLFAYGADDAGASAAAARVAAEVVPVSAAGVPEGGAGVVEGSLVLGDMEMRLPDLGTDFLTDLAVAAVVTRHVGATEEGIRDGLLSFEPGPHRRSFVGSWNGVTWVDDSKATNPQAAVSAAAAYPSVVLIAGGRNKGLDLAPMADMPTVRHTVTMGESAAELEAVLDPTRVSTAESLADAVALADAVSRAGDTVLLAPGCASFDMFDSYAHRGKAFGDAVRLLKEGGHGN